MRPCGPPGAYRRGWDMVQGWDVRVHISRRLAAQDYSCTRDVKFHQIRRQLAARRKGRISPCLRHPNRTEPCCVHFRHRPCSCRQGRHIRIFSQPRNLSAWVHGHPSFRIGVQALKTHDPCSPGPIYPPLLVTPSVVSRKWWKLISCTSGRVEFFAGQAAWSRVVSAAG